MSDDRVRLAIEQMEAWLADSTWEPDPDALAQWNAEFNSALAQAEKAADWSELRARSHAAGHQMEVRMAVFAEAKERLRIALERQEVGHRAMKGYGATAR